jgi:simple sugar transport system ATP-binding protein
MNGICKSFPGVDALIDVDFELRRGEVHALVGENGAGKSTLIKILTGVHRPDRGGLTLDDAPLQLRSPAEATARGISTVYQEINLIPELSIAENLFLGRQPTRFGRIGWRAMRRGATEALRRLDLEIDPTRPLGSCSIAIQQMVAIARALDVRAKILVLDEPTSSLDAREVTQLFTIIRRLRDEGLGIVFITHFLDQIFEVSDRITILRNGRRVGVHETKRLPRLELVSKMIGRFIEDEQRVAAAPVAPGKTDDRPFVEVRKLFRRRAVGPIDLRMRRGEIVGLAGLLGSGRTEAARLLFGLDHPDAGEIRLDGVPARLSTPRRAIARGFGFLPEDRRAQGLIPDLSLQENIILALQAKRGWLRTLPRRRQRALARRFIEALGIHTTDPGKPVRQLSGGNQQKAILARWLATEPALLILDEPTRGVDVGAKVEIRRLIASLQQRGVAILLISSEIDELVHQCQRLVVMRDRRTVCELAGDRMSEADVMRAMAAEMAT